MKTCPRCGEDRTADEFARDGSKASGHKSHCKSCDSARAKRYYRDNRERVISRVLAHRAEVNK